MRIIISDIYYKQENSDITEMLRMAGELIICDHHATSAWLNNVDFQHNSFVNVIADGDVCGTKILFKILDNLYVMPDSTKILEFVENVNSWDVWQWVKQLPETNDVVKLKTQLIIKYFLKYYYNDLFYVILNINVIYDHSLYQFQLP